MTAHGEWSRIYFYVKTVHHLCFISHLYRIPLYIAAIFHTDIMDRLYGGFGWERLGSRNQVLSIIYTSSEREHMSSPLPPRRIKKRQDLHAFCKLHPVICTRCRMQSRAKPDVVR